ncbi:hypothetical protein MKZ38_000086 [Zalerion maritima]|uniref:Splicing factor Cactin n=1 Tax=Zalerion maritima TaxID=339359 RepID=A0AAD5RTI3_9PEZI|nr:hypothetical protein MKZ38_000086 [Zalerion maritima]
MDPARRAMIFGRNPQRNRDRAPGAIRNERNRISKAHRSPNPPPAASRAAAYMTADEQSAKYVADEDKFVLHQAKKKADIRVREGRAKPIDLLAFNLRFIDTDRDTFDDQEKDADIGVPSPSAIVEALKDGQLEGLEGDIKSYQTLETEPANKEYWESLQVLRSERLKALAPQGPEGRSVGAVSSDVDNILGPKTYDQLVALGKQIQNKLASDDDIDRDYWESLLKSLQVYKAKAKLKKVYEAIREKRIDLLRTINPAKARFLEEAAAAAVAARAMGATSSTGTNTTPNATKSTGISAAATAASSSSTAPPPGTARFAQTTNEDFSQATKALYEREVARGFSENEEIFADEEAVVISSKPSWAYKYRPRKPRYFNRVQMGYEWNKYNQTHYDHDNPPPKVVQGYKFNIFYPDLIDKTRAPTFKIIREHGRRRGESFAPAGEEDTCLIRFIAGPPYEDIAFRIVDREWDYSAKRERGFKSSFDKGILQLHFQFKKIFYRK